MHLLATRFGLFNWSRGSWCENNYRVRYGIEARFAPKDKAIALEIQLRECAITGLKVAVNGATRLQAIEERHEKMPLQTMLQTNSEGL